MILALAQLNVKPGVLIDAMDSGRVGAAFVHARKTRKAQRHARIAFATPELLSKVLNAKRRELLKALCGAGPVPVREAQGRIRYGI